MNQSFDFVPFLSCKEYNLDEIHNKNVQRSSGKIPLKIKTITPIHISPGDYNVSNGLIIKRFLRVNNNLIIPGTSIKGCVRTIAEAVSYSCINISQGINRYKISNKKFHSKEQKNNKPIKKACIICEMFGAMGLKSKIQISDFKVENKENTTIISLPASYRPNPNTLYYLDEKGNYKGYKFYKHGINGIQETGKIPHEFVLQNTEFTGEIIFKDLTDEQIELLCFSLGLSGDIHPKIGYGKSYYYGSIEVISQEVWKNKAIEYRNNSDKNVRNNIDKLIEILNYKNAVKTK